MVNATPRSLRRLSGPQGVSGRARKISTPQEFDPRTVQSVASRYTGSRCSFPGCAVLYVAGETQIQLRAALDKG